MPAMHSELPQSGCAQSLFCAQVSPFGRQSGSKGHPLLSFPLKTTLPSHDIFPNDVGHFLSSFRASQTPLLQNPCLVSFPSFKEQGCPWHSESLQSTNEFSLSSMPLEHISGFISLNVLKSRFS